MPYIEGYIPPQVYDRIKDLIIKDRGRIDKEDFTTPDDYREHIETEYQSFCARINQLVIPHPIEEVEQSRLAGYRLMILHFLDSYGPSITTTELSNLAENFTPDLRSSLIYRFTKSLNPKPKKILNDDIKTAIGAIPVEIIMKTFGLEDGLRDGREASALSVGLEMHIDPAKVRKTVTAFFATVQQELTAPKDRRLERGNDPLHRTVINMRQHLYKL